MTISNSVSLSTNFNVAPYYDDYNEEKNFHRILFVPGTAVQARELTQLQTILQNQIDRLGEHIFKEGSIVRGGELNFDNKYYFVKLRDSYSGAAVNAAAFLNKEITGGTSGVKGIVIRTNDGAEANTPNYKTLFVKYTSGGTLGTAKNFANGEVITANSGISANLISTGAFGTGSAISVAEGVIFAKDHFIRIAPQTIILDKYTNTPTYRVGFQIDEDIVTSDDDSTLLDPAQGAYNYAAPGARRLKLTPTLTKKTLTEYSNNFVEFARVENGLIQARFDKPLYNQIRDYLARRTFDESGDYIVRGLSINLREHLNASNNGGVYTAGNGGISTKLAIGVEPGKAYVRGYDQEVLATRYIAVDKGTDYTDVSTVPVVANYGNYVTVNNLCGIWDVNGHDPVTLYNSKQFAASNTEFSTTSAHGSAIGTARVRAVEYVSGTMGAASAVYNLYLYDIRMSANTFADVRGVFLDNATTADAKADVVLTSGNAVLQDTNFNTSIFNLNARNIRRLRDEDGNVNTDFNFFKKFDVTIATDGTFTLATGASDEVYPFSSGALNAAQKRANFFVVTHTQGNSSVVLTGNVSTTAASNTITGTGTGFTSRINVGDNLKITGYANTVHVTQVDSDTSLKVLKPINLSLAGVTYKKTFPVGSVFDMSGVGGDAATRAVTINSTTSASFDVQETLNTSLSASVICELQKTDGQEAAKTLRAARYVQIRCANNVATTVGPWDLGFSDVFRISSVRRKTSAFAAVSDGVDVTSNFELDNGQRDNFYDHGRLKKKGSSTLTIDSGDYLLVKLDYFHHDTSQGVGYFSVDSYPIDDTGADRTTSIYTQEIPVYTSPVTGAKFSLRDSIDIRPRITDTATDATTIGSVSTNPAASTSIVEPTGGLHYSSPNDTWSSDLSYYLSRRDLVVYTSAGDFRVIRGVPALNNPAAPPAADDGLVLAEVTIAPYPSLPFQAAKLYGRPDLACSVRPIKNRRYTMKDIGQIAQRIDRLEYYTSLSMLEKDASALLISDVAGNDRFKNGILVDNFAGHKIGNVFNIDYKAAIDTEQNELRPTFRLNHTYLSYNAANSSNIQLVPKDATVSISNSQVIFSNNEIITAGSATGFLNYQVNNKLYLSNTSGTFVVAATATGGTSGKTAVISAVTTPPNGKLLTLPYVHTKTIEQPYATTTRNAAGLFYKWVGKVTLTPDNDIWVDTTTLPDLLVNFDNQSDNWIALANAWGTQWGDWSTVWQGGWDTASTTQNALSTTTTLVQNVGQAREGLTANISGVNTDTQSLGNRVVDVSIIPFMRSRTIQFFAEGLKPSTRVFAFFDNTNVSEFCTPTNSSYANTANEGGNLLSDSSGNLYGLFRIPNSAQLRFRTGTKVFRLTDSNTNSTASGATTTAAQTEYTAQGVSQSQQETILSTRTAAIEFNTVRATQTIQNVTSVTEPNPVFDGGGFDGGGGGGGGDPIAQTFKTRDGLLNPGFSSVGVFVTKLDLFFASKSPTYPVFISIREVDPTSSAISYRTVPFSQVTLQPSEINVSDDGSKPTPVIFSTPVYLLNDYEYAIVIKPAGFNSDCTVWVSRLGEMDITTGQRITKQPYSGVLFASSNDIAYTAIQEEDLKFNLYTASFNTAVTGTAVLKNEPKDYFTVANVTAQFTTSGETVHGETTAIASAVTNTAAIIGTYAQGASTGATGIVTDLTGTTIRIKGVSTAAKFSTADFIRFRQGSAAGTIVGNTTGVITSASYPSGKVAGYDAVTASNTYLHVANVSGTFVSNTYVSGQIDGKSARIITVNRMTAHVLNTKLDNLQLQGTTISVSSKLATSNTARETSFSNINIGEDTPYASERFVLSRSLENTGLGGESSLEVKATLVSTNSKHSPVVDIEKSGSIIVENLINNDSTGETSSSGGSAIARYITRTVNLADGQDAEDLRVYLTAYKPTSSDIKVYYKILHQSDSQTIDDASWVEMTQETLSSLYSDDLRQSDFKEYSYVVPTAELTGSGGEVQYTSDSVTYTGFKSFAIKIVLLGSNPANPPRVRDFRAIALQV